MSFSVRRRRANTIEGDAPRARLGVEPPRPNVLAGQAAPNRLSGVTAATRSGRPVAPATGAARTARRPAERPATRGWSSVLSTAVFIGFVLLTIARGLGTFFEDGGEPQPTTAPPPSFEIADQGVVLFGLELEPECEIARTDVLFDVGAQVYWSATLRDQIAPDESVGWWLLRDGVALDQHIEQFPDEPAPWHIVCGGPLKLEDGGAYRLEIWNDRHSELLSSGEFMLLVR